MYIYIYIFIYNKIYFYQKCVCVTDNKLRKKIEVIAWTEAGVLWRDRERGM